MLTRTLDSFVATVGLGRLLLLAVAAVFLISLGDTGYLIGGFIHDPNSLTVGEVVFLGLQFSLFAGLILLWLNRKAVDQWLRSDKRWLLWLVGIIVGVDILVFTTGNYFVIYNLLNIRTAAFLVASINLLVFSAEWKATILQRSKSSSDTFLNKPAIQILVLASGTIVFGYLIGTTYILYSRGLFDDAFISFRYSKNLADGYGLVWNPGEKPTEGYTNFLFVLMVAPAIKAGVDPMLMSRVMNFISALGLCALIAMSCRRLFKMSNLGSFIVGLAYLLIEQTFGVALLGMETIVFTFLMFGAAVCFMSFQLRYKTSDLVMATILAFLAFLTRPEGVLLLVPFVIATLIGVQEARIKTCLVVCTAFVVPAMLYLYWKHLYFGYLLPNSFYIKFETGHWISQLGIHSVVSYCKTHRVLISLGLISFLMSDERMYQRFTSACFCVLMILFYSHVDTLMDVNDRFLYPITPFLFFMAIPVIKTVVRSLFAFTKPKLSLITAVFVFMAVIYPLWGSLSQNQTLMKSRNYRPKITQTQRNIGKTLGEYPNIANVMIVVGDSGLIPYYSGAKTIDTVGLNDAFIAHEINSGKIMDYIFAKHPDVVFFALTKDKQYITFGHGRLGDQRKYAHDTRWQGFEYVGTVFFESYDYHLLVSKSSPDYKNLKTFLQTRLIDRQFADVTKLIGH